MAATRDLDTGREPRETSREVEAGRARLASVPMGGLAASGLDELAGGVWGDREGRLTEAECRQRGGRSAQHLPSHHPRWWQ